MEENTDTSLSFLEPLQSPSNSTGQNPLPLVVSPTVIDPDFIDCILSVPRKIEKLFKSTNKINFVYKINSTDFITIAFFRNTAEKYTVFVEHFENFAFPSVVPSKVIFIIGRRAYLANEKNKGAKEYKKSVQNGVKYIHTSNYEDLRSRYFKYQVEKKVNYIFIENGEELHLAIRNSSVILQKDRYYLPKVKSYTKERNKELMSVVLRQIAGVSESVANCLCEKYNDLKTLRRCLIDEEDSIREMAVYNEDKTTKRILGDKIYKKLKKAFLSEDPQEII